MKRALAVVGFVGTVILPLAAQQDDQKKKWDVAQPLGPTTKIEFDTAEGTWMNVDLSPDGKTIVFDLLGDIYTIPVGGGSATRITAGPAYDMQPRFSPDGRKVAFSTDRDGLWNIWTMDADGRGAKQVSSERRWFVNSPTWSPDGTYIFARRHFVKERSLGAGEIWMYHAGGSEGLQVTERNGWQKDAGEPAVSPDGKYLYYSKDVTPGQTFEYNKDPYGVIYAIIRRDLTTGKERTYIRRPGGSIAPRPSPDGKHVAFIRRVGLGSELFLHDVATGEEYPIFDRLDKDLQEAWAIHGVYAQYGWSSDSKAIVIWGEGKIWRVDVAGRKGEPVPFNAHVEMTINDALRFKQDVAPDEFPVRMLRDVATSPDSKAVVYTAVGRLYRKELGAGEPAKVTKDAADWESQWLEFAPRFSSDGRWIVYTAWNDQHLGRVRVVAPDGTGMRDVVTTPGHYTDPAFSPDGSRIVFRAVSADGIRGETHDEETGIFIVETKGGTPRKVRDAGAEPQFDHTGQRMYFRERRNEKFVLASVDLDGSDETVHFQSDNATQIVPSPDGKWVAFAERWRAYVAAFPRTGRPVDLGPAVKGYPVAQISRDAGMYLHWSGDSRLVHWALGPEYFTRDLSRTFAFLESSPEASRSESGARAAAESRPPEPESKGVPIGFSMRADKPEGTVALVGARIITMAGSDQRTEVRGQRSAAGDQGSEARGLRSGPRGQVIENGTILVRGNRIEAIGSSVSVPAGAKRIDVRGKTIVPGLIDVHAHVGGENDGILAQTAWPLVANLAYGVTTSHDPSNDTETVFTNAELARAGFKLSPRLFSTGTILYGAETPFKAVVDSYDDALAHLRRMKAVGAISVKSYNQQRRDARQMIIKAARETGLMVVPEGGSLLYMNSTHVMDGHTGVEHSLPVPNLYQDVVTLFAKSRSGYTPTMIVGYGGLSGEYYWYQHDNVWENKRLLTFTPRDEVEPRSRRRTMAAEDDFNHVLIARGAKKVADAGGLVHTGAHGQIQGIGMHWETWMFAQGGMSPMDALRAATVNGAKYLGLDGELGSIEKGKLADLVVLDRNPLENIRNTDSVRMVMLNGRLYDAETMDEIAPTPRKRLRFYWERRASPPLTNGSAR
ncbi:MAG TPA: amidohydrolase family protein [Vicinamibacterales bacterium]|nr:amidohydrolase family protein [Vicinamibacterales bacterium]